MSQNPYAPSTASCDSPKESRDWTCPECGTAQRFFAVWLSVKTLRCHACGTTLHTKVPILIHIAPGLLLPLIVMALRMLGTNDVVMIIAVAFSIVPVMWVDIVLKKRFLTLRTTPGKIYRG